MDGRKAESSWQVYSEVAGPKLEFQIKKFQERNNEIIKSGENLKHGMKFYWCSGKRKLEFIIL